MAHLSVKRHQLGSRDSGLEKSLPKRLSLLAGKLVLPISWLGVQPGRWAGGRVPPHWASPWAPSQQVWLAGFSEGVSQEDRKTLRIFSDLVSEVMQHHSHQSSAHLDPKGGNTDRISQGHTVRACATGDLRMATFKMICHGNPSPF